MRTNVYAEELTEHVETVDREAPCGHFVGIRFYAGGEPGPTTSAVTLWAKDRESLRRVLVCALVALDEGHPGEPQ